MNIEQLDDKRILISLCDEEMKLYSVSFEAFALGEKNSDDMLRDLLSQASEQTGITMKNKHILIEAMRFENGCLLLVTVSEKSGKKVYKFRHCDSYYNVFVFEDTNSLLGCIIAFYSMKGFGCSSSLLEYKGRYYIALSSAKPFEEKILSTAHEFGCTASSHKSFLSSLCEHARLIVSERAVEIIGSAMKKTQNKAEQPHQ